MEKFSISYDVAAAHVQGRRYCVHLNEGFVLQCKVSRAHDSTSSFYSVTHRNEKKAYETMIQARMQHNQQQQHQQLNGSMTNQHGVRKRAIEDEWVMRTSCKVLFIESDRQNFLTVTRAMTVLWVRIEPVVRLLSRCSLTRTTLAITSSSWLQRIARIASTRVFIILSQHLPGLLGSHTRNIPNHHYFMNNLSISCKRVMCYFLLLLWRLLISGIRHARGRRRYPDHRRCKRHRRHTFCRDDASCASGWQ